MKAKGIPEKIYLQVCGSCEQKYCDACGFEDLEDGITLSKDKVFPNDVEYIRTDAFIEKACEWLRKNCTYTHPRKGTEECAVNIPRFRNYLLK